MTQTCYEVRQGRRPRYPLPRSALSVLLLGSIGGCSLLIESPRASFESPGLDRAVAAGGSPAGGAVQVDGGPSDDTSQVSAGAGAGGGTGEVGNPGGSANVPAQQATPDGETDGGGIGDTLPLYAIGGTVQGLVGQLVLQLNEEQLSVDQDGPFTFEQPLADGAPYSVQIDRQPTAQACWLSGSEGYVAGKAVDDVRVNCEAEPQPLLSIAPSIGSLVPMFDPLETHYRVDLPSWVTQLELELVLSSPTVMANVNGVAYETDPIPTDIDIGTTTIVIEVPATTGGTMSYTVDVVRTATIASILYGKSLIPTGEEFGFDVDIRGDIFAAGAPANPAMGAGINTDPEAYGLPGSGAAYIFERSPTGWTQSAFIKTPNPDESDLFGCSVAVSFSGVVVVGAWMEDGSGSGVNPVVDEALPDAGAAYVFEKIEGAWIQTAYLKPEWPGAVDAFGYDVAVDGDRIAVAAPFESSSRSGINPSGRDETSISSGAVYLFERQGSVYTQTAYIKASNSNIGDEFGTSVAIHGDTVVVGAPFESSDGSGPANNDTYGAGAAYVFSYDKASNRWIESAYLKASNPQLYAAFGAAVGVYGDRVAVGTPGEASSSRGIDMSNDTLDAADSGAVYTFVRGDGGWIPDSFIKASNADPGDQFGARVVLNYGAMVVGAPGEANGLMDAYYREDNSEQGAGAAYVYFHDGDRWWESAYLKPHTSDVNDSFGSALGFDGLQILAGIPYDDSAAGGLSDAFSRDNDLDGAGAIVLFQ